MEEWALLLIDSREHADRLTHFMLSFNFIEIQCDITNDLYQVNEHTHPSATLSLPTHKTSTGSVLPKAQLHRSSTVKQLAPYLVPSQVSKLNEPIPSPTYHKKNKKMHRFQTLNRLFPNWNARSTRPKNNSISTEISSARTKRRSKKRNPGKQYSGNKNRRCTTRPPL